MFYKVFLFDLCVLTYQDFSLFSNNFSALKAEIVILVFLKVQDPDQIYDLRQDKTFYFFCVQEFCHPFEVGIYVSGAVGTREAALPPPDLDIPLDP